MRRPRRAKKTEQKAIPLKSYEVIRSPMVTEKSTAGSEHNQVTFKVALTATKPEIKMLCGELLPRGESSRPRACRHVQESLATSTELPMGPEFRSHRSYRDFAFSVMKYWRYVRTSEETSFLETVLATSAGKEEAVPKGSILWRAQIGHAWEDVDLGGGEKTEVQSPFRPERMKPPRDWLAEGRAFEGRVNPKGIPCLYAATHEETAIAEVRPWVGALITVAQLRTCRDLQVMNCTTSDEKIPSIIYLREPEREERERAVWRDIDRGFSEPVTATDDRASYAPTQILAEIFRQSGSGGLAYRSSVGAGHNVALFDLDAAEVINCSLVRITELALKYSQAAEPYFVDEHYPPSDP